MSKQLILGNCGNGFFSCSFIILMNLFDYFNKNKELPEYTDFSKMYDIYKNNSNDDIYSLFFKKRDDIHIKFEKDIFFGNESIELQFSNYKLLDFESYKPFIEKYFSFNDNVIETARQFVLKYNIDYNNTCGIFYRGNDKVKETQKPPYNEVVEKAILIKNEFPDVKFLVQTDEYEFLQYFLEHFPESIYFSEIPVIHNEMTTVACKYVNDQNKGHYILSYLASIYIFSKLFKLITTSGNGELFIMFYRNNADGDIQYLKKNEYIHGGKSRAYNENETIFWL